MGDVKEPAPSAGRRRADVPVDSGTPAEGRRRAVEHDAPASDTSGRRRMLGRLSLRRTSSTVSFD